MRHPFSLLLLSLLPLTALAEEEAPDWDVSVSNVQEVCLFGRADLAYWQATLAPEELAPLEQDGAAVVFLCATTARFGGRLFHEGILGVMTSRDPYDLEAAFLVQGFNSIRSSAWIERRRNRSPYLHADILRESPGPRSRFEITRRGALVARGAMGGSIPAEIDRHPDFEGSIYLPRAEGASTPGPYFEASLTGPAEATPFVPGVDTFELGPAEASTTAAHLTASHFEPTTWRIRAAGVHAKTRTYDRAMHP